MSETKNSKNIYRHKHYLYEIEIFLYRSFLAL